MRRIALLLLLTGCAVPQHYGMVCTPMKVTKEVSAERTIYFTKCRGREPKWVIFHDPVKVGHKVRYVAFIEDDSRVAHGYLKYK